MYYQQEFYFRVGRGGGVIFVWSQCPLTNLARLNLPGTEVTASIAVEVTEGWGNILN